MPYKTEIVFHVKLLVKLVLTIVQQHVYHAMEMPSFLMINAKFVLPLLTV